MTVHETKSSSTNDDPGVAYLKHPFHLSLEQKKVLLEDARRRRTILLETDCQETDWYSRV